MQHSIVGFKPGSPLAIRGSSIRFGNIVKQPALRGASKSERRLYFDRLVVSVQTALVSIQQPRFHERCNLLVHAPIIAAERDGKRTDASSPVPMHMAQKPTGEGTGLGLSISWDIVTQQHGGSIEVASRPGEFTEFTICLPRQALMVSTPV